MKIKQLFYTVMMIFAANIAFAQNSIPADYSKATLTLANGSSLSGFIKDKMKKLATITFLDKDGKNKTDYDANSLNALKTDMGSFTCINGDFFKIISSGKLNFLQKASNASAKANYNGAEAIFSNGTPGKIDDYFVFTNNELKLLNKKTIGAFISTDLSGCNEAIEKAKSIGGDMAKVQQAVEIYNSYTNK